VAAQLSSPVLASVRALTTEARALADARADVPMALLVRMRRSSLRLRSERLVR
jgi:hypothetical protein